MLVLPCQQGVMGRWRDTSSRPLEWNQAHALLNRLLPPTVLLGPSDTIPFCVGGWAALHTYSLSFANVCCNP